MRFIIAALFLFAFSAQAAELNIYNGYAWVKESRDMKVSKGEQSIRLEDLPRAVDPQSVLLMPIEDAFLVLSQQYRYDLLNPQSLMSRFEDKEITVERIAGDSVLRDKGTLLSANPIILKKTDGTLISIHNADAISYPNVPEGLATKPSLFATIDSPRSGGASADIFYQTNGFRWWVDYTLQLNKESTRASFSADVLVENQSGKTFDAASLALVEGTIPEPQRNVMPKAYAMRAMAMEAASEDGSVAAGEVGDVKRYTIPSPATLPENTTTRLPFLSPVKDLAVTKTYRYQATQNYGGGVYNDPQFGITPRQEVAVTLTFKNTKFALPAGKIRVFEEGKNGRVFIGQPQIQRAAENETIELPMGTAFDITGKRVQESFTQDQKRNQMEETIRITLNNYSKKDVTVEVVENLYRSSNAQILEKSQDFEQVDAQTLKFPIKVPAGGETSLKYKVRYTW